MPFRTNDAAAWTRRRALIALGAAGLAGPARAQAPSPAAPAPNANLTPGPDGLVVLEAKPVAVRLRGPDGPETQAIGFNGLVPGPTLRVARGATFRARLVNACDVPLSLHWHGLRTSAAAAGAAGLSQQPVAPGASFETGLVARDSGFALYRPLVPGSTSRALEAGLAGAVIVAEASPPAVDADHVVLIDDWLLGENGALAPSPDAAAAAAGPGRLGNHLTVNGAATPLVLSARPGARVRLRIGSLANARILPLRFTGLRPTLIAIDGQPLVPFEPKEGQVLLTPFSRYDLIYDLPRDGRAVGIEAALGSALPLVRFEMSGEPAPAAAPLTPLPSNGLPDRLDLGRAQRVDMRIEGGAQPNGPTRPWTINGAPGRFDGPPLFRAATGSTVVVSFANRSAQPLVMHLHGHCARQLFNFDDGWDPFWLDTALVQPGRTLRLAFQAGEKGRWAIHDTVAERFDAGLHHWFEVT